MSMQDITADMLNCIRNACKAGKHSCLAINSKFNRSIADVLLKSGYILSYKTTADNHHFKIVLRYFYDKSTIDCIEIVSKPSKRIYASCREIDKMKVLRGLGILIVSTSKGIMNDSDAIHNRIGGEVIARVY